MSGLGQKMRAALDEGRPAILVEVGKAKGSTPREAGAAMLVTETDFAGTIGGGMLEYEALAEARRMLAGERGSDAREVPLGPDLGQCCGGRVGLSFRRVDRALAAEMEAREMAEREISPSVVVFGAGHGGRALAMALAPLPFRTTIVDPREEMLSDLPEGVATVWTALPEAVIAEAAPGSAAIIATHSHALDFAVAYAALKRGDFAYTGMIGSKTKRAQFERWACGEGLARANVDRLILPIGSRTLKDKRPPVIAALVAAEVAVCLLEKRPSVQADAIATRTCRERHGDGRQTATARA
ncbi:xanthine dehydrogenase accessory protein XdhC [Afifella sp. JA880]|uniref:xanthine dehydrogenase accessory protein XdhC n=1 Tax=Afifella sp. JA880 TaxID=2975280 RepID=UPI0021BA62CE|nr:xanthine dehydrogenase accessory protein XdhC [Afifella sp. JA880]MCT8267181.1 xanthine dehydrogenase accessory protein XdhC [Afifella sp. JA880]